MMVNYRGDLDQVFGALANPTRRAILARLQDREPATVTELAAMFPVSLPAVSKHVKVLERAGLLSRQVEGRMHWLTLRTDPLEDVSNWLSHYREFWTSRLEALEREMLEESRHEGSQPKEGRS